MIMSNSFTYAAIFCLSIISAFFSISCGIASETPAHSTIKTNVQRADSENMIADEHDLREIKFVCNDERIRPMWIEILKEPQFNSMLFTSTLKEEYDCTKMLRVFEEDLNGDGKMEYAVSVKYIGVCSSTDNCPIVFFGMFDDERSKMQTSAGTLDFSFRKVLFSNGMIGYELQESKSNGFRDIMLRHNGSSYNDHLRLYRFDGYKYQLKQCFEEDKGTNRKTLEDCPKDE